MFTKINRISALIILMSCYQSYAMESDIENAQAKYESQLKEEKSKLAQIRKNLKRLKIEEQATLEAINLLQKNSPIEMLIKKLKAFTESPESLEEAKELILKNVAYIRSSNQGEKILTSAILDANLNLVALILNQINFEEDVLSHAVFTAINANLSRDARGRPVGFDRAEKRIKDILNIIDLLLKHGANPNALNKASRYTLIMDAIDVAKWKWDTDYAIEVIKLLLKHGANIDQEVPGIGTALRYAQVNPNPENYSLTETILEFLKAYGAKQVISV